MGSINSIQGQGCVGYFAAEAAKREFAAEKPTDTLDKMTHIAKGFFIVCADFLLVRCSANYFTLKSRYLEQIQRNSKKPDPKPDPKVPSSSYPWGKIAAVTLVAVSIIAVGIVAYQTREKLIPLNDWQLDRSLDSVCKKAVEGYCKKGVCLKDYLAPNWTPRVMAEYNRDILCAVEVHSADCASLVGQPTVSQWRNSFENYPFAFKRNFEAIKAQIPDSFPDTWRNSIQKFHEVGEGMIQFKSHVFCQAPKPKIG